MRFLPLILLASCGGLNEPLLRDPFVELHGHDVAWERQISLWMDRLPSPDAAQALISAGSEVEEPLFLRVKYGTPEQTHEALEILEIRKTPDLAARLLEAWRRVVDPGSRVKAADALGRAGDRRRTPDLRRMIESEPVLIVREHLIRAVERWEADAGP